MPNIWGSEYVYTEIMGIWILVEGIWNDDGIWGDTEIWLDFPNRPVLEELSVCQGFSGETETETISDVVPQEEAGTINIALDSGCGVATIISTLWILADGVWNDNGIWVDTEIWVDSPSADSLPVLEELSVCQGFSGETETEVVEATVKEGRLGITDCDVMSDIIPQEEAGIINTALGIGCNVTTTTILTIFVWILVEGIWNDGGIWVDTKNWID